MDRLLGIWLDLLAQPAQADPEDLLVVAVFGAPEGGEKLLRSENPAQGGGHRLEQAVLGGSQRDLSSGAGHLGPGKVDLEFVMAEDRLMEGLDRLALCPAQDGAHACKEFLGGERLDDVVIRARV